MEPSEQYIPTCEGSDKQLFESIRGYHTEEARLAAIKCGECAVVRECRLKVVNGELDVDQLQLPTVRSGVYIGRKENVRAIVDTVPDYKRPVTLNAGLGLDNKVFLDVDSPQKLVCDLRKLNRDQELVYQSSAIGFRRKAHVIGLDRNNMSPRDQVRLRHLNTLRQARRRGYLLGDPLAHYNETIGYVLDDFDELEKLAGDKLAVKLVIYHSPTDLQPFFDLASRHPEVTPYAATAILGNQRVAPYEALVSYCERVERLLQQFDELLPRGYIRDLARTRPLEPEKAVREFLTTIENLKKLPVDPGLKTLGTLRKISSNHKDSETALLRIDRLFQHLVQTYGTQGLYYSKARKIVMGYPQKIDEKAKEVIGNIAKIETLYSEHPAYREEVAVYFCNCYNNPLDRMAVYLERAALATQQYPSLAFNVISRVVSRDGEESFQILEQIDAKMKEIKELFGENVDGTEWVVNNLAYRHYDSETEDLVTRYLDSLRTIRDKYGHYHVDEEKMRRFALYHMDEPEYGILCIEKTIGINKPDKLREIPLQSPRRQLGRTLLDFIPGGASAEEEYLKLHSERLREARIDLIFQLLGNEDLAAVELFFGFREPSAREEIPSEEDVGLILQDLLVRAGDKLFDSRIVPA